MPAKDGTGPQGLGPRTGRKLGTCSPQSQKTTQSLTSLSSQMYGRGRGGVPRHMNRKMRFARRGMSNTG